MEKIVRMLARHPSKAAEDLSNILDKETIQLLKDQWSEFLEDQALERVNRILDNSGLSVERVASARQEAEQRDSEGISEG